MKRIIKIGVLFFLFISILNLFTSCKNETTSKDLAENWETHFIINQPFDKKELPKNFKEYWYSDKAEITSYKLEQARYGEIRKGQAVLVYVTEDFLPDIQVKADSQNKTNIPVLKLNATKNFNTGIYPYSIMQSTFYPVSNNQHAIKVSNSVQEWCGHVYTQLNNREQFEIMSHSYFEKEADQNFKLNKAILEDELWTQLRINPESLPMGELNIIPSLEYSRFSHIPIKTYNASAVLKENTYTINYPDLNRTISINFNKNFPYDILGWEEIYKSGYGAKAKIMTTKATKLKTIKSAYWEKSNNKYDIYRDTLLLK